MRDNLKSRTLTVAALVHYFLTSIMQPATLVLELYHIPASPVFQLPGRQNGQSQTGYHDHSLGTLLGCVGDEIADPHAGMVLVPAGSSWQQHLFPLLHWTWKPQSYAEMPGLLNTQNRPSERAFHMSNERNSQTHRLRLSTNTLNSDTRRQTNQPFPRQHMEVLIKLIT